MDSFILICAICQNFMADITLDASDEEKLITSPEVNRGDQMYGLVDRKIT